MSALWMAVMSVVVFHVEKVEDEFWTIIIIS